MTIKLKKKLITIKMVDETEKQVKAWVYEDRLACYKNKVLKVWVISHVPTGYQVTTFNGHYRLIRPLLAKVDTLLDWAIDDVETIIRLLYSQDCTYQEIRATVQDFQTITLTEKETPNLA